MEPRSPPASWPLRSLLLCLREIRRVRRPLSLPGRHQGAVRAHQIELLADGDVAGPFQAADPAPIRIFAGAAPIGLVDGPGLRQRAIEYGDHVVQDVRIVLVEKDSLFER